ncbi:MAG: prepilin peptidase [Clostridia bacterium]|nr:prepilin peptidase [Bacilli bacterium]MBR3511471.1 prepilin peptidase [Clostridia bacterium]
MLVYTQIVIALLIGIVSAISDFKNQKIYNKSIIVAVSLSALMYLVFFQQIDETYVKSHLVNFFISCIVSFAFFYFKIWGAGDAKLFIALTFIIPYELYEVSNNNYFASMYLLIYVFSIAFIYVFIETIVLFLIDKEKLNNIKSSKFTKEIFIDYIVDFTNGYLLSILFYNIINTFFTTYVMYNNELVYIINVVMLLFFYQINRKNKVKIISLITLLAINIGYVILYGIKAYTIDVSLLVIIVLIMIFRKISEKYNYKTISVKDLKERMILSFDSVIPFYNSKVKGLPKFSDESTDCRLTNEEVESIKRWSQTPKGTDKITIVRHMPFAPFILLGEILFFVLKVVL